MKPPKSFQFITNGSQIIKLGYRLQNECAGRPKPGFYWTGNVGYPNCVMGSFDRSDSIYSLWLEKGGSESMSGPYVKIDRKLIAPHILEKLDK